MSDVAIEYSRIREALLKFVQFEDEFAELLPLGTPGKRRCWNHTKHKNGDSSHSLCYSQETGGWRCMSCGESGDLFTLYKQVKQLDYIPTLTLLLEKYGQLSGLQNLQRLFTISPGDKIKFYRPIVDKEVISRAIEASRSWSEDKKAFMLTRYGLTNETLIRFRLGCGKDRRVWIPILKDSEEWDDRGYPHGTFPSMVNIRKHDVFRSYAWWYNDLNEAVDGTGNKPESLTLEAIAAQDYPGLHPGWPHGGKVISIKGYGTTYVYPARVWLHEPFFYLVGGELKALLLLQLGLPACSFTTGEGSCAQQVLPWVVGKRVRIIMDPDDAGVAGADKVAAELAQNGALVEVAVWPERVTASLPYKGDVTDLLRLSGWDVAALELLTWDTREPSVSIMADAIGLEELEDNTIPPESEILKVNFQDLQSTNLLQSWVRFSAVVSGRADVPSAIPRRVKIKCPIGAATTLRMCDTCRLPPRGFRLEIVIEPTKQLLLMDTHIEEIHSSILKVCGVPKNCPHPEIDIVASATEEVYFTPTMEERDDRGGDNEGNGVWGRSHGYLIADKRVVIQENTAYSFVGQVLPHPKRQTFTLAVRRWEPLKDDILTFKFDQQRWMALDDALGPASVEHRVEYLLDQVREYVTQIYGQDQMTLVEWLTFFMPFKFTLAQYTLERACPVVLVLGDTTVGKSTIAKRLMGLHGAGRVVNAGADLTHAGLIGGQLQSGGRSPPRFMWGLIPGSNKGFLGFDEFAKMPVEMIAKLTNVITSGVAERTTVMGSYSTQAFVRMLLMTNPRDNRDLNSFPNPMDAALRVMGSPQDLGRVELCHLQFAMRDHSLLSKIKEPDPRNWTYQRKHARYHLQWAWSRTKDSIVFEDVQYIFDESLKLSMDLHSNTLLLPTHAKFKVARVAAAIAALCLSADQNLNLLVKRDHVDFALSLMRACYAPYVKGATQAFAQWACPSEMLVLLHKVEPRYKLEIFVSAKCWSVEDITCLFRSSQDGEAFLTLLHFRLGLIRKMGNLFYPTDNRLSDSTMAFMNEQDRLETMGAP